MMQPSPVYENVGLETFIKTIVPRNEPAVMKGLCAGWPAVQRARASDEAVAEYLRGHDLGRGVDVLEGAPDIRGEFFYGDTLKALNFTRSRAGLSPTVGRILAERGNAEPSSIYVQSTPVREHLPRFERENRIGFMPDYIEPRIWIGNAVRVQTHYDLSNNIAVVVAGKRRFTTFAPDQLPNLYVGPFEVTLAGPPVSLASLENPDFERHPRFREALASARFADLEPGDAIYIPYAWWHHVRSLEPFNILVNYWWNDTDSGIAAPYDALLHAMMAVRDLPRSQREVWRLMFDHYVFGRNGDPVAHLQDDDKGVAGRLTPERRATLMRELGQIMLARTEKPKPG